MRLSLGFLNFRLNYNNTNLYWRIELRSHRSREQSFFSWIQSIADYRVKLQSKLKHMSWIWPTSRKKIKNFISKRGSWMIYKGKWLNSKTDQLILKEIIKDCLLIYVTKNNKTWIWRKEFKNLRVISKNMNWMLVERLETINNMLISIKLKMNSFREEYYS